MCKETWGKTASILHRIGEIENTLDKNIPIKDSFSIQILQEEDFKIGIREGIHDTVILLFWEILC